MLHSAKDVEGYGIRATDGDIGRVQDILFDDEHWTVRYLVVDTGSWLPGRHVLISPFGIGRLVREDEVLTVSSTRAQVEQSPDIDVHQPVSRRFEIAFSRYYGYPFYWGGSGMWGVAPYPYPPNGHVPVPPANHTRPDPFIESEQPALDTLEAVNADDAHLRGCSAVRGYTIDAVDGEIGHVDDFLIEDDTWTIRYLVVSTSKWWFGHKALLEPSAIEAISWADAKAVVDLTRDAIRDAPSYDPKALPNDGRQRPKRSHDGHLLL